MIEIHPDVDALARAAAERIVLVSETAVATRGRCHLFLSGGRTPLPAYRKLAEAPLVDSVPWDRIEVFWTDERCVPPADERSNEGAARAALLDHVPIPRGNVHPIRCAASAQRAASAYDALLRLHLEEGSLAPDLVLLGLGEDGHVASIFPGERRPLPSERTDSPWAIPVRRPGEPFARVTISMGLIRRAAHIVFVVSGAEKAAIVREAIDRPRRSAELPVHAVLQRPDGTSDGPVWILDAAAASLLEKRHRR